jgi:hypothetical protein
MQPIENQPKKSLPDKRLIELAGGLLFVLAVCALFLTGMMRALVLRAEHYRDARAYYSATAHYVQESLRFAELVCVTDEPLWPADGAGEGDEALYLDPETQRLCKAAWDEAGGAVEAVFSAEEYPDLQMAWQVTRAAGDSGLTLRLTVLDAETGTRLYSGRARVALQNAQPETEAADGTVIRYRAYYSPKNIDPVDILPEEPLLPGAAGTDAGTKDAASPLP